MRPRLDRTQRMILVVGLGLACYVLGAWITNLDGGLTGWVGYAPLQNNAFRLVNVGLHPWVRLVIWLLLVVFWTLVSTWLLRPARAASQEGDRG